MADPALNPRLTLLCCVDILSFGKKSRIMIAGGVLYAQCSRNQKTKNG